MDVLKSYAIQYAHEHRSQFLGELQEFLKIPSISTTPEHNRDMERAANWAADHLKSIGMANVQVIKTAGHPVVYSECLLAGENARTVLIYGHYDVQPPDPLDLWKTAPFEPMVREANLYARGASDMKGQIMASMDAVEAIIHQGTSPVNIKFMLEGEEEIGSPSLTTFLNENKTLLKSDFALNPDAGMISPDVPTIVYALRGLAYFEIKIYGPEHDLHSGLYGGIIHNPAQVLCELIAGMHDEHGRVNLAGFYDKVRPLTKEERQELARLPLDDAYYLNQAGVPALWGEEGFTPVELVGARPTLEVNGLYSGFTGIGSKTVIPSQAMAKLSMRLVPDQDPEEVSQQLIRYLEDNTPDTVRWEVNSLASNPASISDRNQPGTRALYQAFETVWGVKPVFKREGGSIPVVRDLQNILGIDSILTGFGLPDDNIHAPNEKLNLQTWHRGIDTLIHFFYNVSKS
jgi:acetylornithine deacetylase/succinyl-diaminopimelate desuccinylase-like protein